MKKNINFVSFVANSLIFSKNEHFHTLSSLGISTLRAAMLGNEATIKAMP
jgi:hypothetical protein